MLWREPFNHTLEEIADLTDEQMASLCRQDVSKGLPSEYGGCDVPHPLLTREVYFGTWRACGKTDAWIEAEWRAEYPEASNGD